MNFLEFIICMCLIVSSADMTRFVASNQWAHLPQNKFIRNTFFATTLPANIGIIALPIYGFIVMHWWQPILGFIIASIFGSIARMIFAGSAWLYAWAMVFSLIAISLFVYFYLT